MIFLCSMTRYPWDENIVEGKRKKTSKQYAWSFLTLLCGTMRWVICDRYQQVRERWPTLVMWVQSCLAVAKPPRPVSITSQECESFSPHLPPPPSSRPGNDPSKAVPKVVPSPITIPLHFLYTFFLAACLFFFLFLSILFVFCNLHVSVSSPSPPPVPVFCTSASGGHCHPAPAAFPSSPRYGHCSQNGQENTNKKHLLKVHSWLPRMRVLNWDV